MDAATELKLFEGIQGFKWLLRPRQQRYSSAGAEFGRARYASSSATADSSAPLTASTGVETACALWPWSEPPAVKCPIWGATISDLAEKVGFLWANNAQKHGKGGCLGG